MYHRVMGYYDQRDIPYYHDLAAQFATSDRFFESVMAGTIPNRMYLFTGTSFGHIFPDKPEPPVHPKDHLPPDDRERSELALLLPGQQHLPGPVPRLARSGHSEPGD
jgi:hypothetical protein